MLIHPLSSASYHTEHFSIFSEASDPLARVFGVLLLGPLQLEDLTGHCLEGHHRRSLSATLVKRVTTRAGRTSIGQRRVARLCRRYERISSKPEFAPLSPNSEPLHPLLGTGAGHAEQQPVAIPLLTLRGDAELLGGADEAPVAGGGLEESQVLFRPCGRASRGFPSGTWASLLMKIHLSYSNYDQYL